MKFKNLDDFYKYTGVDRVKCYNIKHWIKHWISRKENKKLAALKTFIDNGCHFFNMIEVNYDEMDRHHLREAILFIKALNKFANTDQVLDRRDLPLFLRAQIDLRDLKEKHKESKRSE